MKKLIFSLFICLALSGCSKKRSYEDMLNNTEGAVQFRKAFQGQWIDAQCVTVSHQVSYRVAYFLDESGNGSVSHLLSQDESCTTKGSSLSVGDIHYKVRNVDEKRENATLVMQGQVNRDPLDLTLEVSLKPGIAVINSSGTISGKPAAATQMTWLRPN